MWEPSLIIPNLTAEYSWRCYLQIWVLTGDKEETAVNISYSAGHFALSMELFKFTSLNTQTDTDSLLSYITDR